MATILEQLLGMMDDDGKKKVAKIVADNPQLFADDTEAAKLLEIYRGAGGDDDTANAAAAAKKAADDKAAADKAAADKLAADKAAADKAERDRLAAAAASGDANASILAKLTEMNTNLDNRFKSLESTMVKVSDLPKYRDEMTATAIKASDDYATVREEYRAEFGKPIDRAAFEKFIKDQAAANVVYVTDDKRSGFGKALDAWVSDERIKLKIDNGVKEQMKQLRSSKSVPGSTEATTLSNAQLVIKAAKEKAAGGVKSNLAAAIERAEALSRKNEEAGMVQ